MTERAIKERRAIIYNHLLRTVIKLNFSCDSQNYTRHIHQLASHHRLIATRQPIWKQMALKVAMMKASRRRKRIKVANLKELQATNANFAINHFRVWVI